MQEEAALRQKRGSLKEIQTFFNYHVQYISHHHHKEQGKKEKKRKQHPIKPYSVTLLLVYINLDNSSCQYPKVLHPLPQVTQEEAKQEEAGGRCEKVYLGKEGDVNREEEKGGEKGRGKGREEGKNEAGREE